jgi:hypothetical protein
MRLTNSRKVPATSKSTNSGAALTVRYIWQSLHRGALVIGREVRVLARDCRTFVPHDLARDKDSLLRQHNARDEGALLHTGVPVDK